MKTMQRSNISPVGVGLRHPHIADALNSPAPIDFVEVHSENFFAEGGALQHLIADISDTYPVSLHSTAMGLGSAQSIPERYLGQLMALTQQVKPFLMSDHAAFAWGSVNNQSVHGGDLLPLVYNDENLTVLARHVDQIQQRTGRELLVENLSAYVSLPGSTMSEQEFLVALTDATGCKILLDLNNILINARNQQTENSLVVGRAYLDAIPADRVGEIHLAGFSEPTQGGLAVDDHAHPVSAQGWSLYVHALRRFGAVPTLIEWDNQLPDWQVLVEQALTARSIAQETLRYV